MTRAVKQYAFNGLAGCVTQFRSRATKTLVGIYHGEQSGMEGDPESPFVSVCEAHNTLVGHGSLRLARLFRDPTNWCDDCREANGIERGDFGELPEKSDDDPVVDQHHDSRRMGGES